ncbi:MAG: response regulator [Sedimentisphaerales bacterium]|nr:response regulator [Sedimentisphaerales bacterium]MBN2841943.1 response regulator [Sedimentisphaerales bacterium]
MASQSAGKENRPAEILIVDDNIQNAELLEAYLIPLEANVRIAYDGINALEMISELKPDVVLLDVMMPRMSGFEVCERLKNDPSNKDIMIAMVTALHETGDIERGVDCGADEFLHKPINKSELLTRVKALLRVRDLESELERTLSYMEELENRD